MNKFKECNQCPYEFNDKNLEPCKDCVPKKKTNAERIRSMSDEELVEWIFRHDTKTHCYGRLNREELLKWLQSEAE